MVTSAVLLYIGDDRYSKEKAIRDLGSSLLDRSSRQFDYKIFYGQDADPDEVVSHIATFPFMARKRLVVIKDFERSSRELKSRLIAYIKKPAKSACLVLEMTDDSLLQEYADIIPYVVIRRFDAPTETESAAWIKGFLSSRGKKISIDAVKELEELQGQDLLVLSQELEKLALFVGERGEIGPKDVEAVVGKSLAASAFELTAAIEKNDIDNAIRIAAELIMTGRRHSEIIGLLFWYLNRMLRAKSLEARGESECTIANILRIGRRYADDFFAQLNMLNISQVRSRIGMLLDADADIKRTRFDPALILEFAIIRLCLRQ